MSFFSMEHSRAAYRADFAIYGVVVLGLAIFLGVAGPPTRSLALGLLIGLGLAGWTLMEYGLHRFVLHGMEPFRSWHEEHHQRPTALICAPTLLSGTLIVLLVFAPAWLISDLWLASALTLGVLAGYLAYAITHHATHHWRADSRWLKRLKFWHARHHHLQVPGFYGVTSGFWDRVFGTVGVGKAQAVRPASPRKA